MTASTTHCHATPGRARDGNPTWEVADILRLYGHTEGATHPVPPSHHQVIHALIAWRTAELGGHAR